MALRPSLAVVAAAALLAAAHRLPHAQGTKRGNPEEHLPPHIRQLTGVRRARLVVAGRQADRVHGQELRRRLRRRRGDEDDPAADAGAVGRLPARAVPADRRLLPDRRPHLHRHPHHARSRSGDVAAARRGRAADRARPQDLGGRRHLAQDQPHRLVEHARPVSRPDPRGRVGALHGRHRRGGRPAEARQQGGAAPREAARVHARGAGLPLRRHRADLHLLPLALRRRLRPEPEDEGDHDVPQDRRRVQRSRRHLPRRQVDAGRVEPRAEGAGLEPHRHLADAAGAERHRVRARDALGRVRGLQGVEPGGQPGRQDDRLPVGAQQGRRPASATAST